MARGVTQWPYPRTAEEIIQAVMVALAVLLIGLVGPAHAAHGQ